MDILTHTKTAVNFIYRQQKAAMGLAKVVKVMTDHPGAFPTDTYTYLPRHPSKPAPMFQELSP